MELGLELRGTWLQTQVNVMAAHSWILLPHALGSLWLPGTLGGGSRDVVARHGRGNWRVTAWEQTPPLFRRHPHSWVPVLCSDCKLTCTCWQVPIQLFWGGKRGCSSAKFPGDADVEHWVTTLKSLISKASLPCIVFLHRTSQSIVALCNEFSAQIFLIQALDFVKALPSPYSLVIAWPRWTD